MSRRMLVSCRAMPSVSASSAARAAVASRSSARVEDAEREPPDRAGDAAAVHGEVVEALVASRRARPSRSRRPARRTRRAGSAAGARRRPARPAPGRRDSRPGAAPRPGPRPAAAASRRPGRSPSPMSSTRRANAYTADSARRFGRGQQPDAPGEVAGLLAGDPLAFAVGRQHGRLGGGRRRHRQRPASSRSACTAVRPWLGLIGAGEHVVVGRAQRVGGGQAAADVAGDRQPGPARQPAHERRPARAARRERSTCTLTTLRSRPLVVGSSSCASSMPAAAQLVGRQVDPARPGRPRRRPGSARAPAARRRRRRSRRCSRSVAAPAT